MFHCNPFQELDAYYKGNFKIDDAAKRSLVVASLAKNEEIYNILEDCFGEERLRVAVKEHLSKLIAGLKRVAKSKDLNPWWWPFGKKCRASKDMQESVEWLEIKWEGDLDGDAVKSYYQTMGNQVKDYVKGRKKRVLPLTTFSRYREGVNVQTSPRSYPSCPGFSTLDVQVRRHSEIGRETSATKIKVAAPQIASPGDATKAWLEHHNQRSYAEKVFVATKEDRDEFQK